MLTFQYEKERRGRAGRVIMITGESEATTETYWKNRGGEKRANQRLLKTALNFFKI